MFWCAFVRSPRAEAALVSGEALAECVRAGHVATETVQSIELERGHCRVREGRRGGRVRSRGGRIGAESEGSRGGRTRSPEGRGWLRKLMWKWGVSAVWVPLQASVGGLRARGSVCTLERVFFSRQQGWVSFFFRCLSFGRPPQQELIASGRQAHSDLQLSSPSPSPSTSPSTGSSKRV